MRGWEGWVHDARGRTTSSVMPCVSSWICSSGRVETYAEMEVEIASSLRAAGSPSVASSLRRLCACSAQGLGVRG